MVIDIAIASDKDHADILADVVGHPAGAPTVEELDYMCSNFDAEEIRRHLSTLEDAGIVQISELEPVPSPSDSPTQFAKLTSDARERLNAEGLFPQEAWQRQYTAVEKPPRIKELEALPRPRS
ncbi:ArsR family transcriptional regulator [Halogeometricum luteum]|uniref:ArsR family transcriptional regulator n=1 Tax=Halogeometricum luteum TaxID=2950537 RepID=A0ABU2G6X1_9EURY|nr:ArsR family transcriptional regulator [Halogeometricum sp. S3BR5-2]MDS0296538.1 ArsR family transcriptional regulator [Halogeometricum sp. S3BR5-2]